MSSRIKAADKFIIFFTSRGTLFGARLDHLVSANECLSSPISDLIHTGAVNLIDWLCIFNSIDSRKWSIMEDIFENVGPELKF